MLAKIFITNILTNLMFNIMYTMFLKLKTLQGYRPSQVCTCKCTFRLLLL